MSKMSLVRPLPGLGLVLTPPARGSSRARSDVNRRERQMLEIIALTNAEQPLPVLRPLERQPRLLVQKEPRLAVGGDHAQTVLTVEGDPIVFRRPFHGRDRSDVLCQNDGRHARANPRLAQ